MHYRIGVLAMVTALAACSDPPTSPQLSQIKSLPRAPHPTQMDYDWSIPTYYNPPQSEAQNCKSYLNLMNWRVTSSRTQTLRWTTSDARNPMDVVSGQFNAYFRYWRGTVGGVPLQCINLDSMRVIRSAYWPQENLSKPTYYYSSSFNYCYGYTGTNPCNSIPRIWVSTRMEFGRQCFINNPGSMYWSTIVLGGHITLGHALNPAWQVALRADGGWDTEDYGGNGDNFAYDGFAEQGFSSIGGWSIKELCSRYTTDHPDWYPQRAGEGSWQSPTG